MVESQYSFSQKIQNYHTNSMLIVIMHQLLHRKELSGCIIMRASTINELYIALSISKNKTRISNIDTKLASSQKH